MRVLLVTNVFPPLIGGPATFVDLLGHELARRGHRVTVVCSSPSRAHPGDRGRPFRVVRVSTENRYLYEVRIRLVLLRELLLHRRVFVNLLETYVAEVNRLLRRSFVLKVVGDAAWERARNLGATALDIDAFQRAAAEQGRVAAEIRKRDGALRQARCIVTPSRYLKSLVVGWGVPAEKVRVIPNGVEDELLAARPPEPRSGGRLRALFVGRLTNWKGVETLLLAVRSSASVDVTIVGDGPEQPSLRELADQLGLNGRARFLGRLDRGAARAEMERADVLVLTSLYEGHSHTLLEAGAAGLPCIASARGGNPEVIADGENGLLIPPQDPQALGAALERLARDEPFRHALATAAWRRSRERRLARSVDEIVELMEHHG
jgi:glycosyltransferase involved in cell wall biosynthesis